MPLPSPPSPLILFELLHHANLIIDDHRHSRRIGLLRRCELWLEASIDLHVHMYLCSSPEIRALYDAVIEAERCIIDIEATNLRSSPVAYDRATSPIGH